LSEKILHALAEGRLVEVELRHDTLTVKKLEPTTGWLIVTEEGPLITLEQVAGHVTIDGELV
jgi:hypothetical protein